MQNNEVNVQSLLDVGAHFGHPTSKWNPNYANFIATKKNGIHIIDLHKTEQHISKAVKELQSITRKGGSVLFVGTKKQAKSVVQEAADKCGMYYIVERWLGGTLTNFMTIKKSIKRLLLLEKESSDIYQNITKKEHGMLQREKVKLSDLHRGIKDMKHLPRALFVVDGISESIAISEARNLNIPTFGIIDSNTDPNIVDFPIPANDDSVKCINLIVNHIADAINDIHAKKNSSNEVVENKEKEPEKNSAADSSTVEKDTSEKEKK
tara:strand:- start:101 stop:895 length:795 start_codon:yes stop_codon:yes gene_type:complete